MTLSDIPTPALIVDVRAMERNIARMAAFFAEGPCRLRPHFKAHKTLEIARRQLAAGSVVGLTCATVAEAEVAAASCRDILVANEVVSADKCKRLAALASNVRITVAVDSLAGLAAVSSAASRAGVTVHVLVDVNVGQNRCGVTPGAEAVTLARAVHATEAVTLAGVMGYEGHIQPMVGRSAREEAAHEAMRGLVATADLLRGSGLPCGIVSAGGTGTFDISGRVRGVTEIQAGSYVLMDTDYGRLDLPFEQALFALGTVVSRPAAERVIADCGHKACSKDHGLPSVVGIEGAVVVGLNDEHATITVPTGSRVRIGDRLRLCPSHVDPTVNLHDALYAVDGDTVVGIWPVEARGYADERTASRLPPD
jgi:D-serine deaminase-like pyridoxal phosphate-dependent protein